MAIEGRAAANRGSSVRALLIQCQAKRIRRLAACDGIHRDLLDFLNPIVATGMS
jgi:hypothetical protein